MDEFAFRDFIRRSAPSVDSIDEHIHDIDEEFLDRRDEDYEDGLPEEVY